MEDPSETIEVSGKNVMMWKTYCYKGHKESPFFLWLSPVLSLKFAVNDTPMDFRYIRGGSQTEVESLQGKINVLSIVTQKLYTMMNKESETIAFSAFNYSCLGVYSDKQYAAMLVIKMVELWLVVNLAAGLLLFLSAKSWSRNTNLHYGAGVSVGVMASLIILAFVLHRVFPQSIKKIGYVIFAVGCSASLYMWTIITQYLINPTTDTILLYWKWVTGYIIFIGLISFAVCYKFGPVTDQRSLSLIQWTLQLIGLIMIYNGTQIREFSIAIIVTLLTLYNLRMPRVVAHSRCFIYLRYKLFPPKIRLLTEEEYQEQGIVETKKALDQLREFCRSPDCDPWKTISRLKDPSRFASFIEGQQWHITDEELLEYDSGPEVAPVSDPEEEEEEEEREVEEEEEEISGEAMDTTDNSISPPS
ncbi:hypothetical protein FSP39_024173 [Pinctada imbricata]|uniref:Nuclear envelope integral membrane protein 1 n=1 Tax=Pinctada imbricata TaxID=66713 RepID=A0AA88YR85_PINIB|nr:hypothetical protein FSP39_024173 [Pinctada imbricata]